MCLLYARGQHCPACNSLCLHNIRLLVCLTRVLWRKSCRGEGSPRTKQGGAQAGLRQKISLHLLLLPHLSHLSRLLRLRKHRAQRFDPVPLFLSFHTPQRKPKCAHSNRLSNSLPAQACGACVCPTLQSLRAACQTGAKVRLLSHSLALQTPAHSLSRT